MQGIFCLFSPISSGITVRAKTIDKSSLFTISFHHLAVCVYGFDERTKISALNKLGDISFISKNVYIKYSFNQLLLVIAYKAISPLILHSKILTLP